MFFSGKLSPTTFFVYGFGGDAALLLLLDLDRLSDRDVLRERPLDLDLFINFFAGDTFLLLLLDLD